MVQVPLFFISRSFIERSPIRLSLRRKINTFQSEIKVTRLQKRCLEEANSMKTIQLFSH